MWVKAQFAFSRGSWKPGQESELRRPLHSKELAGKRERRKERKKDRKKERQEGKKEERKKERKTQGPKL